MRTAAELRAIASRKGVSAEDCDRYVTLWEGRSEQALNLRDRELFARMAEECRRMAAAIRTTAAPATHVRCVVTAAGDIRPCDALETRQVDEGADLLGIVRQRLTDLKRTWTQYVFKWQSPQRGVVLKYCPFCGASLSHHSE